MKGKLILIFLICILGINSYEANYENRGKPKKPVKKTTTYKKKRPANTIKRLPTKKIASLNPDNTSNYDEQIANVLNKYKFNGSVLVVKQGEVIFKKAKGYSNFESKIPLNENTAFQLASVSKQFTAMGIMMLYERGLLDYDDKVCKYITDFPYKSITIKQLLSHTSGIPNYLYLIDKYWDKRKKICTEDVLSLFKKHPLKLRFPPGSNFHYSNSGYVILALLTERISKQPFHVFLKENIFDKLEMHNTYVYDKSIMRDDDLAKSYRIVKQTIRPVADNIKDYIPGDKGIYSTIEDLYKWDKALYTNTLVSESTINEAYQAVILNNNQTRNYGYGWRIKDGDGQRIIYHNGWWHGYKTAIHRFIDDKNTIIVLNNTNSHIQPLISEIQKILYPDS